MSPVELVPDSVPLTHPDAVPVARARFKGAGHIAGLHSSAPAALAVLCLEVDPAAWASEPNEMLLLDLERGIMLGNPVWILRAPKAELVRAVAWAARRAENGPGGGGLAALARRLLWGEAEGVDPSVVEVLKQVGSRWRFRKRRANRVPHSPPDP